MAEGIIDLAALLSGGGVTGTSDATLPYTPLSFPLEWPEGPGILAVDYGRDEVRGVSESPFTLQRQVIRHAGERWRWVVTLPPMTRERADLVETMLLALDGGYGAFVFGDPFYSTPRGVALGSPKVEGGGQTGKILQTKDWDHDVTGILKAGDQIQIGTSLYKILRDANSNSIGQATLDIWPRLRVSPADGAAIITNYPKGLFRLASPGGALIRRDIRGVKQIVAFEIIEVT